MRPNRPLDRTREPITVGADYAELEHRALASAGISHEEFMNRTPWKKR